MSVTYGFYNSKEGDRRYDAIQMSSIFDGIIRDGVIQHFGTAMMVKEAEGMMIHVGIGRAWFHHTWTLNDALLPLIVPISEVILDRVDAVVLEVDARESVRANSIKIVKGTPASRPVEPVMVKTDDRWQYPLAYIRVNAGAASIRQADITNCVGTSACPFVTAPLEKMSIDDLVAQWKDQWQAFYENETADMKATNALWKQQWNSFYQEETDDMKATNAFWKQQWSDWFYSYVNGYTAEMAGWRANNQRIFDTWFSDLKATLSGDVAAKLANQLLELQRRTQILEKFSEDLSVEYTVYHKLYDSNSELILDSDGDSIAASVLFAIK